MKPSMKLAKLVNSGKPSKKLSNVICGVLTGVAFILAASTVYFIVKVWK